VDREVDLAVEQRSADGGGEDAGPADRGQRVRRLVAEGGERDEVDVVAERPQPVGHLGGLGEGEGAAARTEAQGGHDAPPSSWCTAVGGVDTAATGSFKSLDTGSFKTSATGTHRALKSAAKSAGPNTKRARPHSKTGTTGRHKTLPPIEKKSLAEQLLDEAREVELSESGIRKLPKNDSLLSRMFGKLTK